MYSTVQHSTVQYRTVQYSTVHCSAEESESVSRYLLSSGFYRCALPRTAAAAA
jgi:hypothetical protein